MRVKRGIVRKRRHNKYAKLASGFRGKKKNCYSVAKRGVEKAWEYAYVGRKQRKREFRKLWIMRINAAARLSGMSYSQLIGGLNKANIEMDRKMLADLAVNDASAFAEIAEKAKAAL